MNYISLSQIQKLASKRVVSYNRYNYFLVHLPTIQLSCKPVHLSTTQATCLLVNLFTRQLVYLPTIQTTCQLVYSSTCLLDNHLTCSAIRRLDDVQTLL